MRLVTGAILTALLGALTAPSAIAQAGAASPPDKPAKTDDSTTGKGLDAKAQGGAGAHAKGPLDPFGLVKPIDVLNVSGCCSSDGHTKSH